MQQKTDYSDLPFVILLYENFIDLDFWLLYTQLIWHFASMELKFLDVTYLLA